MAKLVNVSSSRRRKRELVRGKLVRYRPGNRSKVRLSTDGYLPEELIPIDELELRLLSS